MDQSNSLVSNSSPGTNGCPEGYQGPYVRIVEQPARCALRFRYECEGRSAGSIPGASATPENKTYPTIQIHNLKGPAVVVVSCVTKEYPYRPHPHNLVGKDGCKKGVCTMVINNADMICSFTSLGIQCVKRKDIEESLKLRELIKVDPFRTGFAHKNQASNIDLNVVRLCFQVFIEGPEKDKFTVPLPPIVSEPIYDKKAMSDLIITKLSHCSAPVTGGKEIILLCDRVAKDDIQIRFSEERNGQVIWEGFGDFQPNDIHKQVAISFRTPKYYDENVPQPVTVSIQLRRPSDGHTSESRHFQLVPKAVDPDGLARKRAKLGENNPLDRFLKENPMMLSMIAHSHQPSSSVPESDTSSLNPFNLTVEPMPPKTTHEKVKMESDLKQSRIHQKSSLQWSDPIPPQSAVAGHSIIIPAPASSPYNCVNITPVPSPRPSSINHLPPCHSQAMAQSNSQGLQTSKNTIPQSLTIPQTIHHTSNQSSHDVSHSPNADLGSQLIGTSPSSYTHVQKSPSFNIPDVINEFGNNQPLNNFQDHLHQFFKNSNMSSQNSEPQQSQAPSLLGAIGNVVQGGAASNVHSNGQFVNNDNNPVESTLSEKFDSLDLDIDSNCLLEDINLNNLLVMMDSGNNITFNSSGNINIEPNVLNSNTPHDSRAHENL